MRIVGVEDPEINGKVFPIEEALKMAEEREVDLVEIVPNADPPVCRLVDYSKFIFEQKKREKALKSKQQQTTLKEIRFGPNTGEHDFEFKLRHARAFLEEGHRLKAWIHFYGRSILHTDRGKALLERFIEALSDIAKVEIPPKLEGKRMFTILVPDKKKKAKKEESASQE